MLQIFRITSNDYRLYREACQNTRLSQCPDEEHLVDADFPFLKKKEFLNLIQNPSIEIYILKEDDEPKGICEIFYEKNRCYISHFSVAEQRKGFGTFFFQELEKIIHIYGYHTIYLHCVSQSAGKFWTEQGFDLAFNQWTYVKTT